MERKSRNILVVLIVLVIAVAVFSSFGLELYARPASEITLPTVSLTQEPSPTPWVGESGSGLLVEVTPETVQNVIRTLERPASYYRQITVTYAASGGTVTSQQWVDGGWTRTQLTSPSGRTQNTVVHGDDLWLWYDRDRDYVTLPAEEHTADLAQRFPTYEDVLRLEPEDITDAGYAAYGSWNCVYVEAADRELGCRYRYWVDVGSGLLVGAETEQDGQTVYRMTASALQTPCPATASFRLPDGQVLHQVG